MVENAANKSALINPEAAINDRGAVMLHPAVLLNMCDHYQRLTRAAATARVPPVGAGAADSTQDIVLQSSFNGRAVGILFGVQRGLTAELFSSFEMAIVVDDGVPTVKRDFVEEQINISASVTFASPKRTYDAAMPP